MNIKRPLIIVLLAFAAIVIYASIYEIHQWRVTRDETKSYLDNSLPAITAEWNADELWNRASPEFTKSISIADLDKIFSNFSKHLGKLEKYDGVVEGPMVGTNYILGAGTIQTATYKAKAEFERGPAMFTVTLIKHDGEWEFIKFSVTAKALSD